MPTSPTTSILAAVTQALPGPDDPVDGREAGLRQAVREGADRLGAAGDDERVDLEQAGRAEQDRVACGRRGRRARRRRPGPTPATRAGTTVMTSDDGYGRRAAGDVAPTRASGVQRRSISMPGAIVGARRGRALGLGEAADVGRSPGRARARIRGSRRVARGAQVVGVEDEAAVGAAAADARRWRRGPRRRRRARTSARIARAASRTRGSGDGAAADEGVAVGDARRVAGGDRAEVEAAQAEPAAGRRLRRAHGTIFSIGSTRMPDAPAAFSRGQQAPDLVRADDRVDRDHPGVGERDDRRRLERRAGAPRARRAAPPGRSSSGTCGRGRR